MIGKAGDEFKSWYRAAFEVENEAVREPKQEEKKVTVSPQQMACLLYDIFQLKSQK